MNFVITHVTNTTDFIKELEAVAPQYLTRDEEDNITGWSIQTTPIVKSDNGTLAMSILSDEELTLINTMTTIKNLGTYEEIFSSEDNEAHLIYKSVYPYDVPLTYTDEDGNEVEYYKPKKIGSFAQ